MHNLFPRYREAFAQSGYEFPEPGANTRLPLVGKCDFRG